MFLQICFPNIFTQVGILTVQFLEDRFFFLKKYIIAIKSEETGLNRQLKDAVSLATKILKYPLNSKTLQKKWKKHLLCSHSPVSCMLKPSFAITGIHTDK